MSKENASQNISRREFLKLGGAVVTIGGFGIATVLELSGRSKTAELGIRIKQADELPYADPAISVDSIIRPGLKSIYVPADGKSYEVSNNPESTITRIVAEYQQGEAVLDFNLSESRRGDGQMMVDDKSIYLVLAAPEIFSISVDELIRKHEEDPDDIYVVPGKITSQGVNERSVLFENIIVGREYIPLYSRKFIGEKPIDNKDLGFLLGGFFSLRFGGGIGLKKNGQSI